MKDNNECDIVKDLSSQYVEDMVSSNTKEFIEKHIENCNNCKEYYETMKLNILKETNVENEKENCELNFLKKVRNKMSILKKIITIIVIIAFFALILFFIKYQKLTYIINQSYNQMENMKNLSNYLVTKQTNYIDFRDNSSSFTVTTNSYYKDGKYKIDFGDTTEYYEDDSYNKICVFNDLKQIDYYTQDIVEMKKGRVFNTLFCEIISYKNNLHGMYKFILSVREDRYNGIDCYIIRVGNDSSYRDVWVNKNDFAVFRVVEEEYLEYFREELYTFTTNTTTDDDVDSSILNTDLYKDYTKNNCSHESTKEEKQLYELLNQ